MRSEIQKATHTLLNFCADNALEGASDQVPADLIASAWGLAFLTTMQAGFFFSARVGSGLVVARTRDGGWSAPSAVCTAGAGWGLQIGGEVTDMLVVLNCVEINQCVGCILGDDAAVLARSSGEEPASPRHRAGVASMV